VTSTEAAAAAEACAPMFVLLTGSQPVVISFVQQRALSHARTTPPPPASHPLGSPPPLAAHPSYHFATKPLAEQRQRQQNGVSFPFSVSFPVRPKLSPLPAVFPLGRRPWSRQRSPPVSLKRRASVLLDRRPTTDDPSLGPLSGHFDLCAFHFVVQYSYANASRNVRLCVCLAVWVCVCGSDMGVWNIFCQSTRSLPAPRSEPPARLDMDAGYPQIETHK